jgi:two-component system KDP operon response regulator KdpE
MRTPQTAAQARQPLTGRVLIIEDQQPLRRVLELNLAARGLQVDNAASGIPALGLARRNSPRLIIVDLGLPGMDGLEVITRLRAFCAAPILVISARDSVTAAEDALAAGADDYLGKPFAIDDLISRIQALCAGRGHQDGRAEPPAIQPGQVSDDDGVAGSRS